MNTLRKSALLWEQRSQQELIQAFKAFISIAFKAANLSLFLVWSVFKFLTNLLFWLLAGSRPVIRVSENQYQELSEVYPNAHKEPATQILHLGRKA